MPRQIFRNKVIAVAGPLPGQFTSENLKQWTNIRKGRFSEDFDEDVTHLLCTREQFDKRVSRVKEAIKRGKRLHLLHYDWFEFSAVENKKLPEWEYSMRRVLAKQMAKRRELARIERGKREGEKGVNTNLFHIYYDRDFFAYHIDITRDEDDTGNCERYTLCLWESNAKPHLYWFTARHLKRKGDAQPNYYRPSDCSGKWRDEMSKFADFFHKKTGIEWPDRVTLEKTMPANCFQYSPPTGGKPLGRRLRFCQDHCLEINANLRGLPWPPEGKGSEEAGAAASETEEVLQEVDVGCCEAQAVIEKDTQGTFLE